jgi:hypothetical protein
MKISAARVKTKNLRCQEYRCQHCLTLMFLTCCVELASQWEMGPSILQSYLSMDGCVIVIVPYTDFVISIPFLIFNFENILIFYLNFVLQLF